MHDRNINGDEKLLLNLLRNNKGPYPPSTKEISEELLVSRTRVYSLLRQLEGKGYIRKKYYTWRSLVLLDQNDDNNQSR